MKHKKIKSRVVWKFNPITRVVQSKNRYNRNKSKATAKAEIILVQECK